MKSQHIIFRLTLGAIILFILSACTLGQEVAPGGPRAWIDVPRDGSVISLVPHQVIAHTSDAAGVQLVELLVNGVSTGAMVCENPSNPLATCSAMWNPSAPGEYRLEVRASTSGGAVGLSAPVYIKIGHTNLTWEPGVDETNLPSETSTHIPSETVAVITIPAPTDTSTSPAPVCAGSPEISFFTASPSVITVGQSTTLSWGAVSNASQIAVDPDIGSVAAPGAQAVNPKTTTTYTLSATGCGGTQTRQLTVTVNPVTPTNTTVPPIPDTDGPAAPAIVMPTNNAVLPCSQDVELVWTAPNDPSGIARYRVRLQVTSKVNPTDNDWEDVKIWDPLTGTHVGANDETTCGGYYRWRVVAYDGAGNQGKVSVWALFQIALP